MTARTRKLIGLVGIMAFLAAYITAVTADRDHVPDHWAARLVVLRRRGRWAGACRSCR